ncbi:hypothetical protein ACIQYF_01450 [Pseudomonas sp. NPDC096917]|uniref:hypothetical protein n=1 Tax=Pseudomonas sp. NPDC096917 TaxID=3364483 RepID=UPI00383BC8C9
MFKFNPLSGWHVLSSNINNDVCAPDEVIPAAHEHTFFVISIKKFLVLYFMTMGLYLYVWLFEHWKQYRKATGVKVWVGPRTLLGVIMIFSLFAKVDKALCESGRIYVWYPTVRAVLIFTLGSVAAYFALVLDSAVLSGWLAVANMLLLAVMGGLLIGAQRAVNFLEKDPTGQSNSAFSLTNVVWIVLGALVWLLWFLGVCLLLAQ